MAICQPMMSVVADSRQRGVHLNLGGHHGQQLGPTKTDGFAGGLHLFQHIGGPYVAFTYIDSEGLFL